MKSSSKVDKSKNTKNTSQETVRSSGNRVPKWIPVVSLILAFVVGSGFGYYFLNPQKEYKSKKSDSLKEMIQEKSHSDFSLLNPSVAADNYKSFSCISLVPDKKEIESYIKKVQLQDPAIEVSVYFKDLYMNSTLAINDTAKFSPASLMKVPVLIALLKRAENNPSFLSNMVTYAGNRENMIKERDESNTEYGTGLVQGKSYSLETLAYEMIVNSDNEATFLILDNIDQKFVEKVQTDLGFILKEKLSFYDDIISVKSYSTFFRTLFNASYLNREMSNKALKLLSEARYGYGIRRSIPSNIKVAQKFGISTLPISSYEEKFSQLHHFGIVYYTGKPFLIGIMTKGSSESEMEEVIYQISSMVYTSIDNQYKEKLSEYLDRDLE